MRIWVDPDATLSEIAHDIGVKERAVYLIVRDLVEAGFIEKEKVGRRNQYHVNIDFALDYRPIAHTSIREQILGIALSRGMKLPDAPAAASKTRKEAERVAAASH